MFYNPQHQNSSPGIAHKLSHPTHDPSAMWNARPPGPPPNGQPQPPQTQPNASGRAPSPATYGMVPYPNGAVHHGQMHHHQHHNSITTYTSPSSLSQPRQGDSPASVAQPQPIPNHHWQQQLLKAELCRSSSAPHHRARASALATRNSAKSAIPITNPNAVKVPSTPTENGSVSGLTDEGSTATESSAANGRTVVAAAAAATAAAAAAAARPTAPKTEERAWTTLDMGGMRLKILSPGLWNFTYLTTLYLNHNNLTSIPPEISQLRSLIVLDLTGNQLMSVPVELGMLTAMRELYLFDNLITTLPPELGSMHHLEMIGIEGNPMDATLRNIVQKDGTAALISYLRDSCPVPHPPPERLWRYMMSDLERKALDADPLNESFTVLNYNILCERCATTQLYGYTPSWALSWEYRKELILTEIMNYDADILCLQEVDVGNYEDYFKPQFASHDYESVYWPKARANTMKNEEDRRRVDGCAIFFRSKKFQLVDAQLIDFARLALSRDDIQKTDSNFNRVFVKDHIAVVAMLENKASGSKLIVANAHIHWDPEFSDVKLVQVAILMDEVDKFAKRLYNTPSRIVPAEGRPPPPTYSDSSKIPMIISGDYNSVPETGVYQFLSTGSVPKDHPDFLGHDYGKFAEKQLSHKMGLKSAYSHIGEPAVTNYTPSYQGVLDYIFYATTTLTLNAVLGEVDGTYLSKVVGFPNAHFPSDHICIMGDFRVRLPPKEIQPGPPGIRQPFPPPSGTPK